MNKNYNIKDNYVYFIFLIISNFLIVITWRGLLSWIQISFMGKTYVEMFFYLFAFALLYAIGIVFILISFLFIFPVFITSSIIVNSFLISEKNINYYNKYDKIIELNNINMLLSFITILSILFYIKFPFKILCIFLYLLFPLTNRFFVKKRMLKIKGTSLVDKQNVINIEG